jgi:hypothetical protein
MNLELNLDDTIKTTRSGKDCTLLTILASVTKTILVGDLPESELDVPSDKGLLVDLGDGELFVRLADLDSDALALVSNDLVVYLDDALNAFHHLPPGFSGTFVPFFLTRTLYHKLQAIVNPELETFPKF